MSDHGHDHSHSHAPTSLKSLLGVIALTGTIFFAELIAGFISGSLALLSDAMHMLSDSTGLILALLAMLVGRRPPSNRATFGHRRVEVLAAAINAVAVTLISVWIVVEALRRFGQGTEIDTSTMLVVAVIGLIANGISAMILTRRQHDSLNMKGAYLHVLSDLLGSVAVIVAGLIIKFTGFVAADTIASLIIAALVIPRSVALARTSVRVLLNQVPEGVDTQEVERRLRAVPGVCEVHDLHLWSTDGNEALVTCHLVVRRGSYSQVLDAAQATLREMGIEHSTIQVEEPGHKGHEQVCGH
ncbi:MULTISPECIES: cation diffusion facilitator family transporter [unclassified Corynebacterium]|uniref:cation diffusion facilitator family transporter n=1 Tax=unclassified Corynebacterium TaxID=2624378 RepID=UPI0029C9DA35|nr:MULTISPECIES: cation diffusion facilitator family transporter [unclassified Corynebacterium]WPF67061.1 cation diffusion facilitator family transporter [Corynebacterium sp. 22KM0430]WPF69548.1 cation diffusion facilitator family transporter [Corynebacterium sp. 21KM1197]